MRIYKIVSVVMALLMMLSVGSVAATTAAEESTYSITEAPKENENVKIMQEELSTFIKKNDIDPDTLCFGYYDFNRELRYTFHGEQLFTSYDAFKFPLAYLYFKDLAAGERHLNEDVGDDNLRTVFLRSLEKDYNHDADATQLLIEKYGGMKKVKTALHELTYTKVDKAFFDSDALSADYSLDFLIKYYLEALYCSADFKHMLIDPLKQISPERYSETDIIDYKITHRYGVSRENGACVDMGIVNTSNPFAFVISVEDSAHYEDDIALLAKFALDFNEQYGSLSISQMTTLPDVDEKEKKGYDSKTVTALPLMIILIASTVLIAGVITTIYIVQENKKKKRDRLD